MKADVALSPPMPQLKPRSRWRLPVEAPPAELVHAAREAGASDRIARLLAARRYATTDIAAFFASPESCLHDPALLPDADRLVRRVARAVADGERVVVFGDFDADGLSGLAILTIALRRLGLDVLPYVPSRIDEGHGLSKPAIDLAAAERRTLLFTVDCGSSSVAEIDYARACGVDVVVTDHHRLPARLPGPVALVNPHRDDGAYPDHRLSGSGVALKVAQLLAGAFARGDPDEARLDAARDLADLALVGTVADVAPLLGENRAIARVGLERIRRSPRPGIAALADVSGTPIGLVDPETIAFALAPRLNAVGRLGDATAAARLLLSEDVAEAATLAGELERINVTRRELTAAALDEARAEADRQSHAPAIVLAGAWPVGVVGLVAGRLAEERRRPAVVFSTLEVPWRGSARSVDGLDLASAFASCADLFERFGGHTHAAGATLVDGAFAVFADRFRALLPEHRGAVDGEDGAELAIDLVLPCTQVDYVVYRELSALDPLGPGHPVPIVGIEGLVVTRVRSTNGGHTQLTLRRGLEVLDAIAFDRPDLAEVVKEGDRLDVVARLASRTFGGFESLQLEVRDVAPGGYLAALAARLAV